MVIKAHGEESYYYTTQGFGVNSMLAYDNFSRQNQQDGGNEIIF